MKTIKKMFESLYKKYIDELGSCLFLEFTFVFFTSDIQFSMHTNNRQPKSMYVLSENSIPFQSFIFSKTSSVNKGLGRMTSIS